MKITNVGYNYRHSREFQIQRPNGSGDCILLIIKTEAFVFFGGKREIVPPNSVILFKKGTPQMYGAIGDEYVNDWIHFDADAEDERLISDLGIPFDTVIPLHDATELLGFIKNILKTLRMRQFHSLILMYMEEVSMKILPLLQAVQIRIRESTEEDLWQDFPVLQQSFYRCGRL